MRTHPLPRAGGRLGRLAHAALVSAALTLPGCLRNPSADAAAAQAFAEIGDQLGSMQHEMAALQDQIDSLRTAVARQDTVLRRLANMAGVAVPP